MKPAPPRFTAADMDRAHDAWGANCGPGALAAILGLTLDEVRPLMGDFERKRYTNPTLMIEALRRSGTAFTVTTHRGRSFPVYGLARIQWEGPWTSPGVPIRARYRYTHWVGAALVAGQVGIFDVNALGNGSGWATLDDWAAVIVPFILQGEPRASGAWHVTHAIEVARPGSAAA